MFDITIMQFAAYQETFLTVRTTPQLTWGSFVPEAGDCRSAPFLFNHCVLSKASNLHQLEAVTRAESPTSLP